MGIDSRLDKLEKQVGVSQDGSCNCTYPGAWDIRYYPGENSHQDAKEDTREPEPCQKCGLSRQVIKVVYVDGQKMERPAA